MEGVRWLPPTSRTSSCLGATKLVDISLRLHITTGLQGKSRSQPQRKQRINSRREVQLRSALMIAAVDGWLQRSKHRCTYKKKPVCRIGYRMTAHEKMLTKAKCKISEVQHSMSEHCTLRFFSLYIIG
eukprot:scaffold21178_cov98-Skeletonema_dohrnii-CCMP3373.AAC.8